MRNGIGNQIDESNLTRLKTSKVRFGKLFLASAFSFEIEKTWKNQGAKIKNDLDFMIVESFILKSPKIMKKCQKLPEIIFHYLKKASLTTLITIASAGTGLWRFI